MSIDYVTVPLSNDEAGLLLPWMYRAQASGPAASAIIRKLQDAKKHLRNLKEKSPMLETDRLVGMPEEDAIKLIETKQLCARVVSRDGEVFVVTADFRSDRINLDIAEGLVTQAKLG